MDWFPWYPALFRADTVHLSCLEDGAYRRLIDWYMETRQPLPDNDSALARITGLTVDEWTKIAPTIRAFFIPQDGRLNQKHCDRELASQNDMTSKRAAHAKHAASMRWASPEHAGSMPKNATGQDRTGQDKTERKEEGAPAALPPTPKEVARQGKKLNGSGSRIDPEWDLSPDLYDWTMDAWPQIDLTAEQEKFRDYWQARAGPGGVKRDWDAVWRNWVRKAQDYANSRTH